MVGIYFSGTGNSRYAAEMFCKEYDETIKAFSIEELPV
jgi:flavodoxin